jgi:predicted lipoprotein with Yx(FWY)xxD motif
MRPLSVALLLAAAPTLTGSAGNSSGGSSAADQSKHETLISTAMVTNPELHRETVLVSSPAYVEHVFSRDLKNTFHPQCRGRCEAARPPVIALGEAPHVAYGGHPLHAYVHEHKPGEALGQGATYFGGHWHALRPTGTPIPRGLAREPGSA